MPNLRQTYLHRHIIIIIIYTLRVEMESVFVQGLADPNNPRTGKHENPLTRGILEFKELKQSNVSTGYFVHREKKMH